MRTDTRLAARIRLILSALIPLAFALLSSGCGGLEERALRAKQGVVVIGVDAAAESLDPRIGTSLASYRVHQLVFNPLADQDLEGRIVPALAAGWSDERIEDEEGAARWRWTFRLRRGVRFHDGKALTAGDVVYTFSSLLAPDFISRKKAAFAPVESVEADGNDTVVFTLRSPQPWFPASLAAVGIVPEGWDGESDPVGTGPFRLVSRKGSNLLEFEAYSGYFDGAPTIDGLVIKVIPDPTTMALELMHGSIDLTINDVSANAVPLLGDREGLSVVTSPGLPYEYIGINHRHPILGDRRVRQAIAHAIDREEIIATYLDGLARPAVSPLLPQLWGGDPEFISYDFDPEESKLLLDNAGYADPDGDGPQPRFTLVYKCSTNRGGRDMASIYKDRLARVGIALDVRSLEFQTFYADIVAGNFALYQLRWIGIANPDFFGAAFHSTSVPGAEVPEGAVLRGSFNRGRYANPDVDALIERAEAELDLERRWEIVAELQRTLSLDLPYVDLWYRDNYAVLRSDLEGLELSLNASFAHFRKLRYRR